MENSPGVISWGPEALSSHLIKILDAVMIALRTQRFRSYFFPWCNVMLREGFSEEDYLSDAALLEAFLNRIHETASEQGHMADSDTDDWSDECKKKMELETLLIQKWGNVLSDLAPRFSRFSFNHTALSANNYSRRQLDYIGYVLREMLTVREIILQSPGGWLSSAMTTSTDNHQQDDSIEDLIYLILVILDQVKETIGCSEGKGSGATRRRGRKRGRRKKYHTGLVKPNEGLHTNLQYDAFVSELTDAIRQDVELSILDLSDDCVLVRQVLRWLYRAQDDRFLGPHLRPYLNRIFAASHENGWYLEEFRRREKRDELKALGSFSRLLAKGQIEAEEGLTDASGKGWIWANDMTKTAKEVGGIQLLVIPSATEVHRFDVLPDLLEVSTNNVINNLPFNSRTLPSKTLKASSTATMTLKHKTSTMMTQGE